MTGLKDGRSSRNSHPINGLLPVSAYVLRETARFDLIDWNAVALEVIETLYQVPASNEPSLSKCGDGQKGQSKRSADAERENRRRKGTRALNEEISKFYQLPRGELAWKCPRLLSKSEHGRDHSMP